MYTWENTVYLVYAVYPSSLIILQAEDAFLWGRSHSLSTPLLPAKPPSIMELLCWLQYSRFSLSILHLKMLDSDEHLMDNNIFKNTVL